MHDTELISGSPRSKRTVVIKGSDVLWMVLLIVFSALAYAVGFFVFGFATTFYGYSEAVDFELDNPNFDSVFVMCFYICTTIFVYGIFVQYRAIGWRELGFAPFDYRKIKFALLFAGLWFASLAALKVVAGRLTALDELFLPKELDALSVVLALISYGLVTSVAEEILFRGLLYRWLRQTRSALIANGVSSVAFALTHIYFIDPGGWIGWGGTVYVGLFGAFVAYLFEKSGSLWPGIVFHGVNNILLLSIGVMNAPG